jgi:hypothetical protein
MSQTVNTDLVIGDLLFVIGVIMIRITNGLSKNPLILGPLLSITFVVCLVRHINYYKLTNRIY